MVIPDQTRELANYLVDNRNEGRPVNLFLGPGCAKAAGVPTMEEMAYQYFESEMTMAPSRLKKYMDESMWQELKKDPNRKDDIVELFYIVLANKTLPARYSILQRFYTKVSVPRFYFDLARLIASGYFEHILTTSIDTLLEQALDAVGGSDYRVISLAKESSKRGGSFQDFSVEAPVVILKLQGDLPQREVALSPNEIEDMIRPFRFAIKGELSGEMLMAGYAGESDAINTWLTYTHGRLWWVNKDLPEGPEQDRIEQQRQVTYIDGPWAHLDLFFNTVINLVEEIDFINAFGSDDEEWGEKSLETLGDSDQTHEKGISMRGIGAEADEVESQYLQEQITQGYGTLADMERKQIVTGQSSQQVKYQLDLKRQEIASYEDQLRVLTHSDASVLQLVLSIKNEATNAGVDQSVIDFIDSQYQTLENQFNSDPSNQHVIAAAIGAITLLAERLGSAVISSEQVSKLNEIAPGALTRRV